MRSAYYFIMEKPIDNSHLRELGAWDSIWKLKVPQRVKVLIWRATRGCLPAREKLQTRRVQCSILCPFCEINTKNEWHIFFDCPHAVQWWSLAGLWSIIHAVVDVAEGFSDLMF